MNHIKIIMTASLFLVIPMRGMEVKKKFLISEEMAERFDNTTPSFSLERAYFMALMLNANNSDRNKTTFNTLLEKVRKNPITPANQTIPLTQKELFSGLLSHVQKIANIGEAGIPSAYEVLLKGNKTTMFFEPTLLQPARIEIEYYKDLANARNLQGRQQLDAVRDLCCLNEEYDDMVMGITRDPSEEPRDFGCPTM